MRTLPPRTYKADRPTRRRLFTSESMQHPAKMSVALCRDLFLRYTLPGQTVLDPFGGIGTSLLGCLLGRNVILHELEPPFVAHARANWERLQQHTLPGMPLGEATILQGDSRRLPLPSASDAVVSSPPYADAVSQHPSADNLERRLERRLERMAAGGVDVNKRVNVGGPNGQHRLRQAYGADAVVSSPPYGDLASRDRTTEPYCEGKDPALRAKYGTGDTSRHIDGYGEHTPGQIGDLVHQGAGAGGRATNGHQENYASACLAVYRECFRVVRPGGVLVLVVGSYVRGGKMIDLAADTVALAVAAGWTPWERWRHEKAQISFWRHLHAQQAAAKGIDPPAVTVTHEDVLVFVKGERPAWAFAELPPTIEPPADLAAEAAGQATRAVPASVQRDLFSVLDEANEAAPCGHDDAPDAEGAGYLEAMARDLAPELFSEWEAGAANNGGSDA